MQGKLDNAAKMLQVHGFSLREACKEAKVGKVTVKKWLAKQQRKEAEASYKLPKQEAKPLKKYKLHLVKQYIDERKGNVFIKDVQAHLKHQTTYQIPESTLG